MKQQKYMIISTSGNRYTKVLKGENIYNQAFLFMVKHTGAIRVKDQQGIECLLITDSIECYYKDGAEVEV